MYLKGNELFCEYTGICSFITFPLPFQSARGDRIVIPTKEGLSIPSDLSDVNGNPEPSYLIRELSGPFIGITNGVSEMLITLESPDDGSFSLSHNGNPFFYILINFEHCAHPRRLRYTFFRGGRMAMANRYRQSAEINHALGAVLGNEPVPTATATAEPVAKDEGLPAFEIVLIVLFVLAAVVTGALAVYCVIKGSRREDHEALNRPVNAQMQ
jgi:hypothetical protein